MTSPDFALPHQARRAALLAEYIRDVAQRHGFVGKELEAAIEADDQAWELMALCVEARTGKPFRPPSKTTRAICIGLLFVPELEGLIK